MCHAEAAAAALTILSPSHHHPPHSCLQSRTLGLMQRLAMNWRQEWEVYHNEWTAQARLVEGIAGGAKAAQAAAAAQQLTKAAVKAAVALEAELGDDLCPGGWSRVVWRTLAGCRRHGEAVGGLGGGCSY